MIGFPLLGFLHAEVPFLEHFAFHFLIGEGLSEKGDYRIEGALIKGHSKGAFYSLDKRSMRAMMPERAELYAALFQNELLAWTRKACEDHGAAADGDRYGKIIYGLALAHGRREAHTALAHLLAEEISPFHKVPLAAVCRHHALIWMNWSGDPDLETVRVTKEIRNAVRGVCQGMGLGPEMRILSLMAALAWGIRALAETRGVPDPRTGLCCKTHFLSPAAP